MELQALSDKLHDWMLSKIVSREINDFKLGNPIFFLSLGISIRGNVKVQRVKKKIKLRRHLSLTDSVDRIRRILEKKFTKKRVRWMLFNFGKKSSNINLDLLCFYLPTVSHKKHENSATIFNLSTSAQLGWKINVLRGCVPASQAEVD